MLASSNDQGGAYIETSSIDGETNLKLRMSANIKSNAAMVSAGTKQLETIEEATVRITSISALVHPEHLFPSEETTWDGSKRFRKNETAPKVTMLTTEPPNASVHTFSGKLTLPDDTDIPLSAENVVLRGAVIRNTEWVLGIACFTGVDTKLVRNSFDTPSKFSQLDQLINKTVLVVLAFMMLCIIYLATKAVYVNRNSFDALFYAGYNRNATATWPYLPDNLEPPDWQSKPNNFLQFFLMYGTYATACRTAKGSPSDICQSDAFKQSYPVVSVCHG